MCRFKLNAAGYLTGGLEYRTREMGALLSETQWGWADDKDQAYVFDAFNSSEPPRLDEEEWSAWSHANALRAEAAADGGNAHVQAVVFGRACADARTVRRREDRDRTTLRSAHAAALHPTPQECFARLEKEHLA